MPSSIHYLYHLSVKGCRGTPQMGCLSIKMIIYTLIRMFLISNCINSELLVKFDAKYLNF